MLTNTEFSKFTLDLLLEEVNNSVKKERVRAYCDILICYPRAYEKLPKMMEYYSDRKRSAYTVTMSQLAEENFYLVSFYPKRGN